MEMISNRPYLIRAIYDWIVDNEWTPHFQVDANYPGTDVPQEFVQEGVIVLNAHPSAVFSQTFDNEGFSFKARFQGIERTIFFPPEAVLAVFARENGQGMPFPPEPYPEGFEESDSADDANKPTLATVESDSKASKPAKKKATSKKPTLSIVK